MLVGLGLSYCPYSKLEQGGRMCESQVEFEIPGPDPGGQPCDRKSVEVSGSSDIL